jgi:hypothetical protein
VWELLDSRFGLDGSAPTALVDPTRYVRRTSEHPIAAVYEDVYPTVCALLGELDGLADLPRSHGRSSRAGRAAMGGTLPAGTGVQVIVPCRDDGDFVVEAIASVDDCARRSVDDRGRPRVELTVVDDGSTDIETQRILDALRHAGRQVITTPGIGLAAARNVALAASSSAAVIPLDADNRLRMPLIDALGSIEDDRTDIVHGPWQRFGMERTVVEPPAMTLSALVPSNTIDACALISRRLLDQLEGWDPTLEFWEDWDLWLGAVGAAARVERHTAVTFDYLVRPGSLSARPLTDPAARERVVARITTSRADLLGPVCGHLIETVHRIDSACSTAEAARLDLEQAYLRLESHHLRLVDEHQSFDEVRRQLIDAHRDLTEAYRMLEQAHAGALAHAAAAQAELDATRQRLAFRVIDPIARRIAGTPALAALVAPLRRRLR